MRLLIILAYLFACLSALAAGLVGISFSETYRSDYPELKLVYEEHVQVLLLAGVLAVLAYGAKLWGDLLRLKPHLQSVHVSGGQLSHKVTRQGIESELQDLDGDFPGQVWAHLDAAERNFAAKRYREAAEAFQKSIEAHPTMSGYLNLGVTLMYVCEYPRAESSFISGIQMARQKGNREFEGAFLLNLGNTYFREGKYARALEFYRSALKFYEQIGDSAAQAAIYHNSGIVYHAQGKFDEALRSQLM